MMHEEPMDDPVMKSAMLWGASEDKSADLLLEEAGLKKPSSKAASEKESEVDKPDLSKPQLQSQFLTTSDLPTKFRGGDPMHAVSAVVNNLPLGVNEPLFDDQDEHWSKDSNTVGGGAASLISHENMAEYSLPEWVMGEVATVPPSWEPLSNNFPVYTWCGRATHSDVTCIMNTTSVFRDISEVMPKSKPQNRKKAGGRLPSNSAISSSPFASSSRDPKKLCRLPYAGGRSSNLVQVKASNTTLLAKERAAESRKRINAQMIMERDEFMEKLAADRAIRLYEENEAATKIQAMFRGFMKRPHTEAATELKRQLIRKRALERGKPTLECSALMKLDDALNLSYIEGVTLPKLRKTKKQLAAESKRMEIMQRSVVLLQSRARILTAKNCVMRLMQEEELFRVNQAVIKVQRVSRGGLVRGSIRRKREMEAAMVLQTAVRYQMKKRQRQSVMLTAKEIEREERRQIKASTKIQAIHRGRQARKVGGVKKKSIQRIYGKTSQTQYSDFDRLDSNNDIPEDDEES